VLPGYFDRGAPAQVGSASSRSAQNKTNDRFICKEDGRSKARLEGKAEGMGQKRRGKKEGTSAKCVGALVTMIRLWRESEAGSG
jgi:hypothetical protein